MKKNGQWLQYLAALSLTLSTSAHALPSGAPAAGDSRVSQRAAGTLNDMAASSLSGTDPKTNDWLQIIWGEWTQIIIIIFEGSQAALESPGGDFGSYAALLESVKNEA